MDAMKFLSEAKRMCNNAGPCETCDANEFCGFTPEFPRDFGEVDQLQKMVKLVEKWAEEHPRKTRQSDFLRLFPQVMLTDDGIIDLCPSRLSENYRVPGTTLCGSVDKNCSSCLREFWGQEVE